MQAENSCRGLADSGLLAQAGHLGGFLAESGDRFGNIDVAGMDLVYLHSALAKLCAAVQAQGGATLVETNPENGQKEDPTNVADELVQFLTMSANTNPLHSQKVKELIEKYIQTRKKDKE